MHRRWAGQITIFAALSFILIISLITMCISSAVKANGTAQIDMAARLSVESAFAGYSTKLMEEFDIMALDQNELAGKLLRYYTKSNVDGICGNGIEYVYGDFESRVSMIARGGIGVEHQVIQYMNVGMFSDLLARFLDIEKETKKAEIVAEVSEEIVECDKLVSQSEALIYDLIELVEGIRTSDGGVEVYKGKAVATGDYFAKAIIMAPLSKAIAAIDSDAVYGAMSGTGSKYTNVYELMDNMMEYAQVYDELYKDKYNQGQCNEDYESESGEDDKLMAECQAGYCDSYNKIVGAIDAVIGKTNSALDKLQEYESKLDQCRSAYKQCEESIENNEDVLGQELSNTLGADIDTMKNTNGYMGAKICNVPFMRAGLKYNLQVLTNASKALKVLDVQLKDKELSYIEYSVSECKKEFIGVSNHLLKFDYNYVSFETGSGLKVIETLRNTIENGLGGLVMGDKKVSDCSIAYRDLASNYKGQVSVMGGSFLDEAKDLMLFNEYIMDRFPNATDWEGDTEQWCQLNYVVEYVLCGKSSDKDNLNGVLAKLAVIREGINMAHLVMDREKKQQAMTLASSMVGATGNAAVVKTAQYIILAVWALGESICDLKILLDGEALPMVKTKEDWSLTLTNLLAMNFSIENDDKGQSGSSGGKSHKREGLTDMFYEDYLRMLLMVQDKTDKRYGVMDAMELRMIALGEEHFRMKDYMWSAKGVIIVKSSDTGQYYIREISYSYV